MRSRGAGENPVAGLRSLKGGEKDELARLAQQARQEALDRLTAQPTPMGANADITAQSDPPEKATVVEERAPTGPRARSPPWTATGNRSGRAREAPGVGFEPTRPITVTGSQGPRNHHSALGLVLNPGSRPGTSALVLPVHKA